MWENVVDVVAVVAKITVADSFLKSQSDTSRRMDERTGLSQCGNDVLFDDLLKRMLEISDWLEIW